MQDKDLTKTPTPEELAEFKEKNPLEFNRCMISLDTENTVMAIIMLKEKLNISTQEAIELFLLTNGCITKEVVTISLTE